jgi:hypothetical protein
MAGNNIDSDLQVKQATVRAAVHASVRMTPLLQQMRNTSYPDQSNMNGEWTDEGFVEYLKVGDEIGINPMKPE